MRRTATIRSGLSSLAAVGAFVFVLVACAVGTNADLGDSQLPTTPSGTAVSQVPAVKIPQQSPPAATGTPGRTEGGTSSDAGRPGTDASTTDAGNIACTSPNVCRKATNLGQLSGDTGKVVITSEGVGSQWLRFRLTEDTDFDDGPPVRAKIELVSPPGTDFNLFVYVGPKDPSNDGTAPPLECSALTSSSTTTGADVVDVDVQHTNGYDHRTVAVEVRWVSGPCNPAAKWNLKVSGHLP